MISPVAPARIRQSISDHCLRCFVIALLILAGCGRGGSDRTANFQPVASSFRENTSLNTVLAGDLTSRVTAPDNAVLSFSLVSDGIKGSATIDPRGTFSYSPFFNARGTDCFTYSVEDLSGGTATATVTVIIGDTRIMPLGASVTSGFGDGSSDDAHRVGYRKPLYDSLAAADFRVDFVGSLTHGLAVPDFDFNHEGHDGFTDSEVANDVFGWLDANPADMVLLYIGANGLNDSGGTLPDDVAFLLNEIDRWEASRANAVVVLLARIIEQNPPNPNVTIYNDNVVTMAQGRVNDNIIIVDHQTILGPADLSDQIHPNRNGYAKMADEWRKALTGVLLTCP